MLITFPGPFLCSPGCVFMHECTCDIFHASLLWCFILPLPTDSSRCIMIHLLSSHPAREAFQVSLFRSGYRACCCISWLQERSTPPSPSPVVFNSAHIPELVCVLQSVYPLADFAVNYRQQILTAIDLHRKNRFLVHSHWFGGL